MFYKTTAQLQTDLSDSQGFVWAGLPQTLVEAPADDVA